MPVKFILFDISPNLVSAWNQIFPALVPKEALENITIKACSMDDLNMPFDTVVSPANSFGRLDGRCVLVPHHPIAPLSTHTATDQLTSSLP